MWHGDPGPGRRHVSWARLRAEMDRVIDEQRTRQAHDTAADAHAMRFTERLEEAISGLDTGEHGFERASRKADHVEELRRLLAILLDVLADWEMIAGRSG
jgi:tRNA nucleotidyltransferase/poly(A) polymerase